MGKSDLRQAFAADATTVGKDSPAALGLHAGAEPVLTHPADLRRLVLAFHVFITVPDRSGAGNGTNRTSRVNPCVKVVLVDPVSCLENQPSGTSKPMHLLRKPTFFNRGSFREKI
jgi:hypothetical protein